MQGFTTICSTFGHDGVAIIVSHFVRATTLVFHQKNASQIHSLQSLCSVHTSSAVKFQCNVLDSACLMFGIFSRSVCGVVFV